MIEQLVAALEQKYQDLTAEEISDILWLALQQWRSAATTVEKIEPVEKAPLQPARAEDSVAEKRSSLSDSLPVEPPERSRSQTNRAAGVTTRSAQETATSASAADSASPLAIPDSTALRRSVELLKAIRPLIRLVPSAERTYLDVPATVKAIAETDLWLLKEKPLLEPWLELALVVDATPSMAIWQRTILRLRRVLAQSGVFRDVRLWSLTSELPVNDLEIRPTRQSAQRLCLRSGFGLAAVRQVPCRPQELIDPKGRRLILVVSDCIAPRWDEQPIRDLLQVWAERGPLGLVQVLPEWLWSRTALDGVTKGQMTADRVGQPSQSLRFMRRDRWQRQTTVGVKVPVMTLEPAVASRWSQMVAGRTSVSVPGLVFSAVTVGQLTAGLETRPKGSPASLTPELTAQERMTQFRDFSSPLARRLAGLLAACPEINLPVIRMVQAALLPDSQQVHVAEVLFGGLFKPQTPISAYAPADQVQYIFHKGVRPLVQDTVLPEYTFAVLSEWLNKRFGYGLEDFQAYLTAKGAEEIKPFAGVLLDVLRQRGGEHADLINRIEQVYRPRYGSFSELVQEEAAAQDYEIRSRQGTSGVVILAIHGGNLQPGTTQVADAVAGDFHSFYSFVSLRPETDQSLYVPSTQFDEPTAIEMIREADTVLSIHGCEGEESFIKVGGRDLTLRDLICSALTEAGFSLAEAAPESLHPDNICNRGKTGQGVQIELSQGLCNRLIDPTDQVKESERFGPFSELQRSLQSALLASHEGDVEFPEIEEFDFFQAQFSEASAFPPPLSTEIFTVRTLDFLRQKNEVQSTDEPQRTNRLETFEFTIATLSKVGRQWQVVRQQGSARRFVETLSSEASGQGLVAQTLPISKRAEDVALEMVAIPGGRFTMGSPDDEAGRFGSESPQHEVSVEPFCMGRYPVTQAQWKTVAAMPQVEKELDADPSRFKGAMNPVDRVSWYEAVEFCARLSAYTGRDYRLPTEAEWEYACRAGTTTAFHFGDMITTEVANYSGSAYADSPAGKSRGQTTPVDQFGIANAYGLSDMHGNVYEWCQDHWHSNYEGAPTDGSAWLTDNKTAYRVYRGGSWFYNPGHCRSAYRFFNYPYYRYSGIGFRVSCATPRALV